MNVQSDAYPNLKKRGPGRPRKPEPDPALQPSPVDPVAPLVTNRHGAAKMLGVSPMSIKRWESNDPTWPRPFLVGEGSQRQCYLIEEVRAWVLKKARDAQAKASEQVEA
ncbi:MAG TPA: hypothetical protein VJU59_29755 [Paraburkholderia sp.]|uniref:helix-turn-helix transcriptional regulator n=1 Tax=Paraburkholderia sp. TaxID=1926495 RepID=UPI002B48CE7C|nr:hypothetical protein [Paraburkholderia sp.]HKR43812.1 hypothetical protein [Paraburkholderia sp.]